LVKQIACVQRPAALSWCGEFAQGSCSPAASRLRAFAFSAEDESANASERGKDTELA
jgi:hypothetical protein